MLLLQLFDHIAGCLASFISERDMRDETLPLGFTFSFPCAQEGLTKARLAQWTKGFQCANVEGEDVVELLQQAIARRGVSMQAISRRGVSTPAIARRGVSMQAISTRVSVHRPSQGEGSVCKPSLGGGVSTHAIAQRGGMTRLGWVGGQYTGYSEVRGVRIQAIARWGGQDTRYTSRRCDRTTDITSHIRLNCSDIAWRCQCK